jgi:hypothetical protein
MIGMKFELGLRNSLKSLKGDKLYEPKRENKKTFTLSLIAGILIVCNAIAVGVAGIWFPWIFPILPGSENNATVPFAAIATIGLICGVLVLFGAIMLRIKPENMKAWSIVIVVFSIPSIVTGGGFILGFILGIIAGVRALKWKPKLHTIKP